MLLLDLPCLMQQHAAGIFPLFILIIYSIVDKVHIQPVSHRGWQLSVLKSQTSILNCQCTHYTGH